ncbi:cell division inhibitor SulA [Shewanella gaetbuli]|uniref:Cell division protein n=1 Tax=Shewanella gaetbuli TaxID=220752 RepID=A0A9X1ZJG4_9GAMM|nr:SulA-like leucine-rich domain-containing protein [Shewanella gaetbuli]MCL1143459.1 cell division protein [Shewanella gaetbuli]
MNKLMGNAPRHPGLWTDIPTEVMPSAKSITTLKTQTHGKTELAAYASELARLSHQGQWIVLINPANISYKQMLASAGVRMDRVLLVHTKDEIETLWAMEKALTSGTSSAVISWTSQLDTRDSRRLQLVAKSARALGVVIEDISSHTDTELADNSFIKPSHSTISRINFNSFH